MVDKLPTFADLMEGLSKQEQPTELTFNTYQELAKKTAIYPGVGTVGGIMYNALQIAAEAGEVAGKIAKYYRDGVPKGMDNDTWIEEVTKEIGDILWSQAQLLTELGVSFSDAGVTNLEKLASRQARGKLAGSGDNR